MIYFVWGVGGTCVNANHMRRHTHIAHTHLCMCTRTLQLFIGILGPPTFLLRRLIVAVCAALHSEGKTQQSLSHQAFPQQILIATCKGMHAFKHRHILTTSKAWLNPARDKTAHIHSLQSNKTIIRSNSFRLPCSRNTIQH